MKELVFLESLKLDEVPFTTDEVIANRSENKLKSVKNLIRQYKDELEEFGVLRFEKAKPPKGSEGGRPRKIYHLNEEQATLLITYLDNTAPVRRFKKELVKQFFAMKKEQFSRQVLRGAGKQIRLSMTDAIRDAGFSSKFFIHFTNLCYKSAIGFNASQVRKARNIAKGHNILDYLTSEEQEAVNQREQEIATLIGLGLDYEQIKAILANGGVIYQTTLKMPQKAI
ncbi:MAG TPA: Rha family transcriptional regulator [Enterococcus sp.]|nr:Rha family transcriptional regulator [Enterococcus sp.]